MTLKKLLMVCFVVCLGVINTACGNAATSSTASQSYTAKSKAATSSHSTSSKTNSDPSKQGTDVSNNADPYAMMFRMDGVISATLKVESKKPNTTVDYKTRTMTQNGKKVTFSLIPAKNHQQDFMKGSIQALVAAGDSTNPEVLYNYVVDSANVVSLIDPSSNKVVYKVRIQNSSINKNG